MSDPLAHFPPEIPRQVPDQQLTVSAAPGNESSQGPSPIDTQTPPDRPTAERATLDELQARIRQAEESIQQTLDEAGALRTDLTELRGVASQLTQDYVTVSETARDAREYGGTAMATIKDIEKQLDSLTKLHESTQNSDELLAALSALADQVTLQGKTLDSQKNAIEYAIDLATRASEMAPDRLTTERAALDELQVQIRHAETSIEQSLDRAGALETDLTELRGVASRLTQDYSAVNEAARDARECSGTAVAAIKDIEKQLGSVAKLHELTQHTDERLAALSALADQVTLQAKALEGQKDTIEYAIALATRATQTASTMDAQLARLNKGDKRIARSEEMLGHIEQLATQTTGQLIEATGQLVEATNAKNELRREVARFEKEAQALTKSIWSQVEQLAVKKQEFEAFDRHLQGVFTAIDKRATLAAENVTPNSQPFLSVRVAVHDLPDRPRGQASRGSVLTWLRTWSPRPRVWSVTVRVRRVSWRPDFALRPSRATGGLRQLRLASPATLLTKMGPLRHRIALFGAVGVLALLVSLIVARPSQETDQIGAGPVAVFPPPVLSSSSFGLSAMMLNSGVPVLTTTAYRPVLQARVAQTPPQPRVFLGALAVQSDPPGSDVFIDRRPVGTTPLEVRRLRAGSHAVWIEHEGYQRWTGAVLVPANQLTRVNVRLWPEGRRAVQKLSRR